jgi:hypothetical protein
MTRGWLCAGLAAAVLALSNPAYADFRCANPKRTLDAKVFTIDVDCPECTEARIFFYREGIPFRDFDADHPEVWQRLRDGPGRGQIPAIQVCGEWFFGFNAVTAAQILRLFPHTV